MDKYQIYEDYKSWNKSTFGEVNKIDLKNYQLFLQDAGIDIVEDNISNIVDFGCGKGTLSGCLIKKYKNLKVIAIDSSPRICELYKKSPLREKISFKFNLSETKDNSIDLFIAVDVLEHLSYEEIRELFILLQKKLSPKGKIICSFPNCMGIMGITNQYTDATHKSFITPPIIKFAIQGTDLKLIKFKPLFNKKTRNFQKKILRHIATTFLYMMGIRINLDYLASGNCFCRVDKI